MKTILIIDDNQDVRDALTLVLTDEQYRVTTSSSGAILHDLTADTLPDLFILDAFLSGESGIAVGQQIRNTKSMQEIPILIISARDDIEKRAQNAGFENFLSKPFDITKLLKKVDSLVGITLPH